MTSDFEKALRTEIAELESRQSTLQAELARAEGRLSGLQHALRLYAGDDRSHDARGGTETTAHRAEPEPARRRTQESRTPDPHRSAAWACALRELEQAESEGVTIDALEDAIRKAGYEISRVTLRSNLSVAAKEGIIDRVRHGRYRKHKISANGSREEAIVRGATESVGFEQNNALKDDPFSSVEDDRSNPAS